MNQKTNAEQYIVKLNDLYVTKADYVVNRIYINLVNFDYDAKRFTKYKAEDVAEMIGGVAIKAD